MKQLYCTTAEASKNHPEVRVRATSAGVLPERVQALLRHAGYASPLRGAEASASPPDRLAFLHTPDAGRFLCHSTCLGIDPTTGRNGHFFSHVLLDVPATLDAQHAIQSWGSQHWQRADQGGPAELPEALYLPVSSSLDDAELQQFLVAPAQREMLTFVLAALLTTPAQTRIFLAAPAESVARCIYGVTRSLPPSLLESLTFSTYERDPLACSARIVGTCWEAQPTADLPAECYDSASVAFNSYSGRKSELSRELPFAEFAVAALADGQTAKLDELHATWQRLGIKDGALFELVYRLASGTGTLTKEESQQVLQHPTLCSWVAVRPDALGQFLEWALDDADYATTTFSRAVAALRQKPDVLSKLGQTVHERGLGALRGGDLARTRNALEALMPMVAPAKSATIWTDLLAGLSDPEALAWDIRGYLLPRLLRARPSAADAQLQRWLDVPSERLAGLLALDLPETARITACLACLGRETEPSAVLARTLASHPNLVHALVHKLAGEPDSEAGALALFRAVLSEQPQHPWGEEIVRVGQTLPAALVDRCVDFALDRDNLRSADLLAAGHGPLLLELLAGRSTLDRIAGQLLSRPVDNLRTDRGRGEFLHALGAKEGLRPETKTRLDAYLGFLAFLKQPSVERGALDRVAAALCVEPPLFQDEVRWQVIRALAAQLGRQNSHSIQPALEQALLALGPTWPGGSAAFYRAVLHDGRRQRSFWKQSDLLHAFLAVALGAVQTPELAGHLENLDGEAYGLAQQVSRCGGSKVLAAIDRRTESWPRAARSQWGFLSRAVQPRGASHILRDLALIGGGIAAGAVGAIGLHWFGVW